MLKEQELPRVLWAASACFLGRISPLGAAQLPVSGFTLETFLHLWDQHVRLPYCTSSCPPSKYPQWDSPPSLSLLNVGEDTNPGRPHWSPFTSLPTFANVLCNGWPNFIWKICTTGCIITSVHMSGETFLPLNSAFWALADSSTWKWFLSFLEIL